MISPQHDIELLDSYLHGKLGEPERIELEQRLLHEKELKADFETLKLLAQGSRLQVMQDKLQLLKDLEADQPLHPKGGQKSMWKKGIITILILLILMVVAFYFFQKSNRHASSLALSDDKFYTYILHKTERSSNLEADAQKAFAYNLFTIKDFEKARPELSELWNKQKDTLAYFYLAITELSLGNKEKARVILNSSELTSYPTEDLLKLCE